MSNTLDVRCAVCDKTATQLIHDGFSGGVLLRRFGTEWLCWKHEDAAHDCLCVDEAAELQEAGEDLKAIEDAAGEARG